MRRALVRSWFLVLVAAVALGGVGASAQSEDEPDPPAASVELRIWQSVRSPLDFWISARSGEDAAWRTSSVDLVIPLGGGWRTGGLPVEGRALPVELRLWQDPAATDRVWLSARPAGGSWDEYGTQRIRLDERSRSGRYRYADVSVALAWPDAEPPAPRTAADALCIPEGLETIPEGLETERLQARVWRSVAAPHRYWISSRPDSAARWSTQRVTLAESAGEGWNAGPLTVDASGADFELRLWEGEDDGALHLSVRVAGTTWHEYGTQALTLNRTSASGRYDYADRIMRLTLPEAEPPAPGAAARTWDCPDPDNRRPSADAGDDQTVDVGDTVTLDGSGSADPDEDDITYAWAQTGGSYTGDVALTGADTPSPTFAVDAALSGQTVEFTLTVTDEHGLTRTDTVMITVRTQTTPPPGGVVPITLPNQAPTANAGTDQEVDRGSVATLDGSASSDPDDNELSYSWAKTGGYSGTITLTGENTASPSFTMPTGAAIDATITFTLTVSDGNGGEDTDTVAITAKNAPPTANAGTDQDAARGSEVRLIGAGTDPENSTLAYSWSQTAGTTVTLSSATAQNPTFTMPTGAGIDEVFTFTLTVKDENGGTGFKSGTDTVAITAKNAPPTAYAGTDQDAARGSEVRLIGAGTDPENSTLAYSWSQTAGTTVTLSSATARGPTFTMPTDAEIDAVFTFTLTVKDENGGAGSMSDTATVNITAQNAPPAARAGADQTAARGSSVTLNGSGSSDADGDTLSYSWAKTGGSYTGTIPFTPQVGQPDHTRRFIVPGAANANDTIIFTLTVTDSDNETGADTVTINVGNAPPVANAGPNQKVSPGGSIQLSGSASDTDGDNSKISYKWEVAGTPTATLSNPATATPTLNVPASATSATRYLLTLKATDEDNGTDTDTMTVSADNRDPTANAGSDRDAYRASTVTLNGSASSDPDFDILSFSWAKTGGTYASAISLTNANTVSPSFTVPVGAEVDDTMIFTLTARDGKGGEATDTVQIKARNALPTVNAGADQAGTAGTTLNLSATASDPDGALTYAWTGASSAMLSSSSIAAPTATLPPPAPKGTTFTFTLTVTDEDGATASDDITLTVNNRPPTANAGSGGNINRASIVTLDGSGSSDPDSGDTLTYLWARPTGSAGGTYSGTVTPSDETAQSPTFTAPTGDVIDDTIIFTLTVSDGNGGTHTDTVTLTLKNAPPTVTITSAGSNQYTATATDPDDASATFTYQWAISPSSHTITNATSQTVTVNPGGAPTGTLTLTVTDEDGGTVTATKSLTFP